MGKAEQLLYRTCLRTLDGFKRSRIPFTGIHGTNLVNWSLDGKDTVRNWCKTGVEGLNSLQDGINCVSRAQRQLNVLQGIDEESQKALNEWSDAANKVVLQRRKNHVAVCDPKGIIQGHLVGMDVISKQITDIMGSRHPSVSEDVKQYIHDVASSMERLLDPGNGRERLESFIRSFYGTLGYKYEPFEWLYEGLDPILISHVMQTKKGTPAALALSLSAIGLEVGIHLLPMPLDNSIHGNRGKMEEAMEPLLESLPPGVANRLNNAGQFGGPNPMTWFVRMDAGLAEDDALYVDCKEGIVLTKSDLVKRFPSMGQLTMADWREQSLLRSWSGLIQLAIQAHQRRGESDLVAHWIYVKLAMEPSAPEWDMVL